MIGRERPNGGEKMAKKRTLIEVLDLLAESQKQLADAIVASAVEPKLTACRAVSGAVKPCPRYTAKLVRAQKEEADARVDTLAALAEYNKRQAFEMAKRNATKAAANALAACQRGDIPDA